MEGGKIMATKTLILMLEYLNTIVCVIYDFIGSIWIHSSEGYWTLVQDDWLHLQIEFVHVLRKSQSAHIPNNIHRPYRSQTIYTLNLDAISQVYKIEIQLWTRISTLVDYPSLLQIYLISSLPPSTQWFLSKLASSQRPMVISQIPSIVLYLSSLAALVHRNPTNRNSIVIYHKWNSLVHDDIK